MRLTRDREGAGSCTLFGIVAPHNGAAPQAVALTVCRRQGSLCGRWLVPHDSAPHSSCLRACEPAHTADTTMS